MADHFCEQGRYYARQGLACPACEFIILLACVFALSELQTLQNLYIIFSLLSCTSFKRDSQKYQFQDHLTTSVWYIFYLDQYIVHVIVIVHTLAQMRLLWVSVGPLPRPRNPVCLFLFYSCCCWRWFCGCCCYAVVDNVVVNVIIGVVVAFMYLL